MARKRILFIDNRPDHLRQPVLRLQVAGYDVDEADSGESGLARFADGTGYEVVLLDQKMPGIDGLETLRRLRERDRTACVVMVTAFASIELAVVTDDPAARFAAAEAGSLSKKASCWDWPLMGTRPSTHAEMWSVANAEP